MGAGDCGLETVDALLAAERSGDGRHFRVVTVVADAHRDPPGDIDTFDVLKKAVHEVLTRLLAVGDGINPGVFLLLQYQQLRVRFAATSASPSSCQGAHNIRGFASQAGFGKLPAIV